MVELGEVAEIERRGVDPSSVPPDTRYLGLEHIERGGRIVGHDTVAGAKLASTKFTFTPDHVLFGKLRPKLCKVCRPEFAGVCSTDILPIRPGQHLDRDYLAHFLAQPRIVEFAASRAAGANLPRLNPAVLAKFQLPLPSLAEQRRIAVVLDHADALRAKRRQALAHLDALSQSIFHDMFGASDGDSTVSLESLTEVASGITKGRRTSEPTSPTPYLAVSNVQAGYLRMDTVKEIEATPAEVRRFALKSGDLVLTEGGDPDKLGRGTVWRDELPLCLHQNHIFRVRVPENGEVLPEFLVAFIAAPIARSYFLRSAKQTTGIASINITQLKSLPVSVPSLSDQKLYVARLARIGVERANHERAISAEQELFDSVQWREFRRGAQ